MADLSLKRLLRAAQQDYSSKSVETAIRQYVQNGETVHIYDDRDGEPGEIWRTVDSEAGIQEVVEGLSLKK